MSSRLWVYKGVSRMHVRLLSRIETVKVVGVWFVGHEVPVDVEPTHAGSLQVARDLPKALQLLPASFICSRTAPAIRPRQPRKGRVADLPGA